MDFANFRVAVAASVRARVFACVGSKERVDGFEFEF